MAKQYDAPPAMAIDPAKRYAATLETSKGTIEAELYPQDAPQTVNNFVCLARDGYFDGTPFHRIVPGFVIQGGDPTGTGTGGPGYRFADEPVAREYEKGTLAMANAGPDTNGSQFFVVLEDLRGKLPKNYTIFGKVTGGMEAVEAIAAVPTRPGPGGENSRPTEPVTLERVTIQEA
jgi:cyclophilin family peptidyl-prolyl cis-trans isomerase